MHLYISQLKFFLKILSLYLAILRLNLAILSLYLTISKFTSHNSFFSTTE